MLGGWLPVSGVRTGEASPIFNQLAFSRSAGNIQRAYQKVTWNTIKSDLPSPDPHPIFSNAHAEFVESLCYSNPAFVCSANVCLFLFNLKL